jgi:methylmalonyl-CoA mutase cobalamin-binding subunit
MRKRYYLSFDMSNPRHREAEALFARQAVRQRSEYVVSSILTSHQTGCLEQVIREVIKEELKNISLSSQTEPAEQPKTCAQLTDLPESLIHALDEL